jgi:hypothetical protein
MKKHLPLILLTLWAIASVGAYAYLRAQDEERRHQELLTAIRDLTAAVERSR